MIHAIARAYAHLPSRQPEGHVERKVSLIRLLILFALLPILWWDVVPPETQLVLIGREDRKSTRLNSSHSQISYAVFCLKKKKNTYMECAMSRRTDCARQTVI